ncbi:N-acetyltransferase GCN5 [Streptomyces albospinus]|uniref:N-acetyltransferase GCN5 n=1 Tax=Streptomyces albospinus TaxID=285515 RepID=A0ABQ2UXJ0_9ACTN|nr:GNAT family N-acetyltransferase [Streptomyces albospinus]GGU54717.1 N-acetyltransferase GCN5 [Streptomyces albospinus]
MAYETAGPDVRIEPWTAADLTLLHEANTPAMTQHLGGPEADEQIARRHRRYLEGEGAGQMFRVVLLPEGAAVGTTGFWETTWRGEPVFEAGWSVLPAYQGRGVATAAARAVVAAARAEGCHLALHAFPSVANAASNSVCRSAGFALVGECEVEYPKGHLIRAHEWRVAPPPAPPAAGPLSAADRGWRAP